MNHPDFGVFSSELAHGTAGGPPLGVPLVPPLYQSSVYTFPDVDALDEMMTGVQPGFIYARDGHPNAVRLAQSLAEREHAAWGYVAGSGMAAISAGLLPLLQSGDRVIVSDRLYGKTTQLFLNEFRRLGIIADRVDITNLRAVEEALKTPARAVFVETLSNPLLRVADLPALAELAHHHRCKLIVDNTFATPVLMKPLDVGADMVVESLTKMIGGHADITLGWLGGNDAEQFPAVNQTASVWGLSSNPFDCWLAERSLSTLELRMQTATDRASEIAGWVMNRPGVQQVVYPGLPNHPDHELARRLFPRGVGNMLTFELAGGREAVNRFMRAAPSIPFSPSLGNVTTTCSHPTTTSHRPDSPAERARQGITEGMIRLSVGVESREWLIEQLTNGLQGIESG